MFFVDVALVVLLVVIAILGMINVTEPNAPQGYRMLALGEVIVVLLAAVRLIAWTMAK